MKRRRVLCGAATFGASVLCAPNVLRAQSRTLRVGVLTDLTGRMADATGRGAVEAVRMAAEDTSTATIGRSVEILSADQGRTPTFGTAPTLDPTVAVTAPFRVEPAAPWRGGSPFKGLLVAAVIPLGC